MRKTIWCLALILCLGAASAALAQPTDAVTDLPLLNLDLDFETLELESPAAPNRSSVDAEPSGELEWLMLPSGGECGFPRPAPSPSCACGTCCDCNRCYNGGRLQKCLDRQ